MLPVFLHTSPYCAFSLPLLSLPNALPSSYIYSPLYAKLSIFLVRFACALTEAAGAGRGRQRTAVGGKGRQQQQHCPAVQLAATARVAFMVERRCLPAHIYFDIFYDSLFGGLAN